MSPSLEEIFGVSQPGDPDYPLKCTEGVAGRIAEIRNRCNKETLYEDPDFPATDESIGGAKYDAARGDGGKLPAQYLWHRPHLICDEYGDWAPVFAIAQEGGGSVLCSGFDVRQGNLGDCAFLSAVSALTSNPSQLAINVPHDNIGGFGDAVYCGAFHFRFFHMGIGKFVDTVVDDRLPCKLSGFPAFARPLADDLSGNEFWPALIEKAMAKFRGGSYKGCQMGLGTAMELLTGGFSGGWALSNYAGGPAKYDELAGKVKRFIDSKQFMGITGHGSREGAVKAGCEDGYEAAGLGLRYCHAYAVLDGVQVPEKSNPDVTHFLLKVKNPWGRTEWTGPFGDKDDAGWAALERDLRPRNKATGSADVDEGVFWIDLRDVIKYFGSIDYCAFEFDNGAKYCTIRSEWPGLLQEAKLKLFSKESMKVSPAFTFEVRRELDLEVPAGKCWAQIRIGAGGPGAAGGEGGAAGFNLDPTPKFAYYIYETKDGDNLSKGGGGLAAIVDSRPDLQYGSIQGIFLNVADIHLSPGQYVLVVALVTDDPSKIPKGFAGKPIPFWVGLYTENKACLEQFN